MIPVPEPSSLRSKDKALGNCRRQDSTVVAQRNESPLAFPCVVAHVWVAFPLSPLILVNSRPLASSLNLG